MNVSCETVRERSHPRYSEKVVNCSVLVDSEMLRQTRIVSFFETEDLPMTFIYQMLKLEKINLPGINRILKVQVDPGQTIIVREKERGMSLLKFYGVVRQPLSEG